MREQRRGRNVRRQHAGGTRFPGVWERGRCCTAVANLMEQVCRGKLPAFHSLGILAACAGNQPGPRCEEKKNREKRKKMKGKALRGMWTI